MPLVSIIVPIYNVEKYIRKCIDSLLSQTFKDFEIILIDDGSTDLSTLICEEYSKQYSQIHFFKKTNEGLGLTRNFGIKKATGKYLLFVDSDDYIESNTIESLVKYDEDLIIGGYNRVNSDNIVFDVFRYLPDVFIDKEIKDKMFPRLIGSAPNKSDSIAVSVCGCLYLKSIIDKNNIIFFSEHEIISEDLFFNLEFLLKASRVRITDEVLYNYRLTEGSLTKRYNHNRFNKIKELYYREKIFLIENNIYNHDCSVRLKKQFFIYLRMCFRQEKKSISKKNINQIIKSISMMCNDTLVQKIIVEYPVKQLGFKQGIFVRLVKLKLSLLLYICIKLDLIK